ncbi:glycosyl hydrolase 115 family protein [Dinghuibacter silviterrae]|uniref:Beta-xylanase n=1 Tax=Dinghuibacter silviterrae TaxID=1539049 RepID=A0A4R8DW06_9BACT|nr:glycosyl hydrolase 115 family protein [Dinghuibacter silviterrae]TDX01587.1 GH35 family endo-1,4-beta-xylanase [Dinghuibacter silviterrae]
MNRLLFLLVCMSFGAARGVAQDPGAAAGPDLVTFHPAPGAFPLTGTPILVDSADDWVVQQAGQWLAGDLQKVTGQASAVVPGGPGQVPPATADGHATAGAMNIVVIGTLEKSQLIRRLVTSGKLKTSTLKGQWDAFSIQVVPHPFKGVDKALVIAGSNKRGATYGALELSREMGVSPWYWWADVPVRQQPAVFVQHLPYNSGAPGVKYRGIFINDEAPAFSGWTRATFGGVNHQVYTRIFELLLRLKANFLWPAMWGNAFNDDDTLNPVLADRYGIVMSTSHHEPMLRAQQEWKRYGSGPWNYETNAKVLQDFWRKGIGNMGTHESVVTIGMRGDGDKPMSEGSNIELLERIVADQRQIIHEVTGKNPADVPQVWALYKEVQDYYDKGMRVPDDVTLLLCDDNWGNLRRLPPVGAPHRKGGYGIYYHFDYVGGPRNYKWLNTNSIARTWEQMRLAYDHDVRQIWVVNVGDLKPMEYPISFFLDYAWDPAHWDAAKVAAYARRWATEQFGPEHAVAIGHLLERYTFFNSRRKPELLAPDTYSLLHYRESEKVTAAYDLLRTQAEALYATLPSDQKDAFFELVLFPIQACANLGDLYAHAGLNNLYTAQGRASANDLADSVKVDFIRDSLLSYQYNHDLAGGKWIHMMDQTHIGYTYWQEPRRNTMPKISVLALPSSPLMGVAVEGSDAWWGEGEPARIADSAGGAAVFRVVNRPGDPNGFEGAHGVLSGVPAAPATGVAVLPWFTVYLPQRHYIDIFNRGTEPFDYTVTVSAPWVRVWAAGPVAAGGRFAADGGAVPAAGGAAPVARGRVTTEQRLWVAVTKDAPPGASSATVTITSSTGKSVTVRLMVQGRVSGNVPTEGFVENDGYVAMNAAHYTKAAGNWMRIDGVGKVGAGMTASTGDDAHLDYPFYIFDTGNATVQCYCSPTLSYEGKGGRRFAVSVDDGAPVTLSLPAEQEGPVWNKMVADNISIVSHTVRIDRFGAHVLHFWKVDPGVVLQKLVIDLGGARPCYLGPPETPMQPGLKDYFRDEFPIGVAVTPRDLGNPLVLAQFNSLTPENAMKMAPIHPGPARYNFVAADTIVAFAQAHGLRVRGHNLCWHEQVPAWMFADNPTKEQLLQRLHDHITAVVSRYKGKVYAWDVVNEAIADDSTQFLRDSPWFRICGEDFIKQAFVYAHAADPQAQLFYNDYNTERPEKCERVYRLLKDLVDEGIPITGVGLQAHWSLWEPTPADLRAAIERFSSLGLKVQFTEIDMSHYPWEKNRRTRLATDDDTFTAALSARQALQYKTVFDIFREYAPVINGLTFWNVSDAHTWLDNYPVPGRKNHPLLFDGEGEAKEAYWEVIDE